MGYVDKCLFVFFCVAHCAIYSVPETGDIMTQDQDQKLLLNEVELFCRKHGLADSKFGALTPVTTRTWWSVCDRVCYVVAP